MMNLLMITVVVVACSMRRLYTVFWSLSVGIAASVMVFGIDLF